MPVQHHLDDGLDAITTQAPAPKPTPFAPAPALTWGSKPISLGDGLDRIKAETGKSVRFALIPSAAPEMARTHFAAIAGKQGMYLCGGPSCALCANGDQSKSSIVALAVQYSNADAETGKLAPDAAPTYEIGYLSLGPTTFNAIIESAIEGSKPTDIDLVMGFDGRRYSFRLISPQARYLKAGDQSKIEALAAPFKALLKGKLGRAIPAHAVAPTAPTADWD